MLYLVQDIAVCVLFRTTMNPDQLPSFVDAELGKVIPPAIYLCYAL